MLLSIGDSDLYRWGDMWRQCCEDFHGCHSVCAHIIREVLFKFTVNRVIHTTAIKRSTLVSSCVTINWPIPCVCVSSVLSMHHWGHAFKTPAEQSIYTQQQYKDPHLFHHVWLYTDPSLVCTCLQTFHVTSSIVWDKINNMDYPGYVFVINLWNVPIPLKGTSLTK